MSVSFSVLDDDNANSFCTRKKISEHKNKFNDENKHHHQTMILSVSGNQMTTASACSQFHQHFTCSFCANFLLPKNTNLSHKFKKSCSKELRMKKLLIKCWWNWHPGTYFETYSNSFVKLVETWHFVSEFKTAVVYFIFIHRCHATSRVNHATVGATFLTGA